VITLTARILPGQSWSGAASFRASSLETGIRTACRRLGVNCSRGRTVERVGASQWRVTGNGVSIMVVESNG
jgi:hypothetical protein